jgi:hypothetical protein
LSILCIHLQPQIPTGEPGLIVIKHVAVAVKVVDDAAGDAAGALGRDGAGSATEGEGHQDGKGEYLLR